MPEQDNDRLEQFFRKAATRADVSFNEDDWKKLEARLDAADAGQTVAKKASRTTTSVVVGTVLLFSSAIWINDRYDIISFTAPAAPVEDVTSANKPSDPTSVQPIGPLVTDTENDQVDRSADPLADNPGESGEKHVANVVEADKTANKPAVAAEQDAVSDFKVSNYKVDGLGAENTDAGRSITAGSDLASERGADGANTGNRLTLVEIPDENINRDLIIPAVAERNKQKAVVELPGAEEGKTREAQAMVKEEHASDKKKHVASPRLSLLLSFAPDFSGTSGLYSAPGKAYGAVLHYHFFDRWTLSAGIIKNQKQYTGSGEEYHPPQNYWRNNTNGIIPETIKGSCSILEYPIMVHYAAIRNERSNWNIGAGVSSYLMQTESYRYRFDRPNPGAKSGWSSRGSSRFMFNMLNFTIGYERQVMPGFMLGIEPYAKIPLQEIGWSNLRLFSAGASVTLRYTIIRKQNPSIPTRSRGPD